MSWHVAVHNGVVFAYCKAAGWMLFIRAFPEATKPVKQPGQSKPDYVPDPQHKSVTSWVDTLTKS